MNRPLWKSAFRLTPNNRAKSVGNSVHSQAQTRKNKNKNYKRNRKTGNRYQYEPTMKQRRRQTRRTYRGGVACMENCINMH